MGFKKFLGITVKKMRLLLLINLELPMKEIKLLKAN